MNNPINAPYEKEITIDFVGCPLHILELKKGLNSVSEKGTLKVITGSKPVHNEIISASHSMGYETKTTNESIVYIKKIESAKS